MIVRKYLSFFTFLLAIVVYMKIYSEMCSRFVNYKLVPTLSTYCVLHKK